MAISTAVGVAAYTVVVAETFAAVGLATLVPAAVVTTARAVNAATSATARSDAVKKLEKFIPGGAQVGKVLHAVAESNRSMDLLVPKSGKIHSEFSFYAREEFSVTAGMSLRVDVVTVKAGYAALYEASSKNKIEMDVEFGLVEFPLVERPTQWKRPQPAPTPQPDPHD